VRVPQDQENTPSCSMRATDLLVRAEFGLEGDLLSGRDLWLPWPSPTDRIARSLGRGQRNGVDVGEVEIPQSAQRLVLKAGGVNRVGFAAAAARGRAVGELVARWSGDSDPPCAACDRHRGSPYTRAHGPEGRSRWPGQSTKTR
jgi:hypothetical protein